MFDFFYAPKAHHLILDDNIEIYYTDEGRGKCTLLFIHGLGSNHKCWQKNIAALKEHYRCISVDLPGYGCSSNGDYPYSMDFFASCIRTFINKLNLWNVVLVGHSMGGQIAITAVLNDASRIRNLALIAPAGFETFNDFERQWIRNMYDPMWIKETSPEQIRFNFEVNFYQFPDDAQFMIQDRMDMRLREEEYDRYCRMIPKCVSGMLEAPVFSRLKDIPVPTLILFGANDLLIPNKMIHPTLSPIGVAETGARQIPNHHLEIMKPCGHFVQWECASVVNRSIRNYLG